MLLCTGQGSSSWMGWIKCGLWAIVDSQGVWPSWILHPYYTTIVYIFPSNKKKLVYIRYWDGRMRSQFQDAGKRGEVPSSWHKQPVALDSSFDRRNQHTSMSSIRVNKPCGPNTWEWVAAGKQSRETSDFVVHFERPSSRETTVK
jgi:hypothetical protein